MGLPIAIFTGAPQSAPVSAGDSGGNDSSGWLSGLGDLFSGVGTAVASGIRASNIPSPPTVGSGWVYNAATGQYYNPATGQALTSTGTLTSAGGLTAGVSTNTLLILGIAVLGFLFLRKRG